MLTAKPPLLHSDGRQGLLPLHVAALFGRSRVLEVILEVGVVTLFLSLSLFLLSLSLSLSGFLSLFL